MKKRNAKRLVALLMCLPLLCGVIFFTAKKESANAAESYSVDTYDDSMQLFDGWGTSLIWWANNVGKYDWEAAGGGEVREEIMNLLYGKDGLEYNIARFNVGGGDNPNHTHVTPSQNMPGYSTLDEAFLPEYFGDDMASEINKWKDLKDVWDMSDVTYNWDADAAQRWCMEWIYKNAEEMGTSDELITEFFSNSPPWYMTQTACSSGNDKNSNLLKGREDEFAQYFVNVLLYLTQQGYKFDYIDPFNESTSDWWSPRSIKQEGCKFTHQERADILYYVVQEMDEHPELDHIMIAFDDSTGPGKAWDAIQKLEQSNRFKDIKHRIGKLNYHLYEPDASKEVNIANEAKKQGWKNWMSEMGYNSAKTATSSTLQTGYLHTDKIRETLYNGANAYVLWQVIEELSSQLNNPDYGFGPIKVSYKSAEEVPELANYGYSLGSYHVSKQYYMLGQYSKYIRPGYRILPTSDKNGVAAKSPDGKKVVLVHTNNSPTADDLTYTLNGHYIKNAQVIVTDENQNWVKSSLAASGNKFSYTVNPYSVTTFVFDVEQYAEKPPVPNKTSIGIKEAAGYTKLASGVALPAIDAINATTYVNNHFYLTNSWSGDGKGGGVDKDSQWVKGNADGSVGAFIKFTNTVEADFVFKCKPTGSGEAATLKFELYEGTTLDTTQTQEGLQAVHEIDESYQVIWSAKGLDKSKKYAVRIIVTNDQWTNLSRVDLYDAARVAAPYEAPQIAAATVKGGNLYVSIKDETSANPANNKYVVYWREAGVTAEAQHETKTLSELGEAVATGLTGNAYDVWVTDEAGEKYSQTVTVRNVEIDSKLVYYVNAGAPNIGNYTIYERAAVNNTYKDQAYGADPITGKEWGLESADNKKYATGKAGTIYQALGDVVSTDGNANKEIVYTFEVASGKTYDIMLGVICPWSARKEEVSVNGTSYGSFIIDGNENFIVIPGVSPAEKSGKHFITIKVAPPTGESEGSMVGTIMISEVGNTANAFATAAEVRDVTSNAATGVTGNAKQLRFGGLTVGYVEKIKITTAYVYGVNGEGAPKTEGVTFDKLTLTNTAPNAEAAMITGVVDGLYFSTPLTLKSDTADVYYFVDSGTNGTNPAPLGSRQTVPEQEAGTDTWGYKGKSGGVNWKEDAYADSVRNDLEPDFHYVFTDLPEGEEVYIEVGGRIGNNWGERSFSVLFGKTENKDAADHENLGTIELEDGGRDVITATVTVPAKTCYMYFKIKTGGKPSVSYIKISTPPDPTPVAPTLNKTEARTTESVVVSGLKEGDLLVIAADDGSRIDEIVAKKAAKEPETAKAAEEVTMADDGTMTVELSKLTIPAGTQALLFSVRHDGSLEEGLQTLLALPQVLVSGVVEDWTDKIVLHFMPSMGVTLQKLVVETPAGKKNDVTKREYFNYVATEGGVYKLHLTTKLNETYVQEIDLDTIDLITIGVDYEKKYTDKDVNVTISLKHVDGALKAFTVNGEEKPLEHNAYSFVADQNADYEIKATSQGGHEFIYTLNITNIDKENAKIVFTPDYTVADGFTAALVSGNISGGSFTVTKGGVNYGGINGLHLVEAGEYAIAYTSGTNKTKSFTIKLGYGAGSLGSLSGNALSGLGSAKVYQMGTGTEVAVSDGSCTLAAGYRYAVVLQDGDNYEVQIITVEAGPAAQATAKKKGCGSAADAALPVAALLLMLAGAAVALIKKGGERA